jgi:hypothetical protein
MDMVHRYEAQEEHNEHQQYRQNYGVKSCAIVLS